MSDQDLESCKQDIAALNQELQRLRDEKMSLQARIDSSAKSKDTLQQLLQKHAKEKEEFNDFLLKRPHSQLASSHNLQLQLKKQKHQRSRGPSARHQTPEYLPTDIFDPSIRSLLDTSVLYSPSKKALQSNTPEYISALSQQDLESLQRYTQVEKCYRVMLGLTCFPLRDPLDNKTTSMQRDMVGLRFDLFDQKTRSFKVPYYILFKYASSTQNWKIFKSTVPENVVGGLELLQSSEIPILSSLEDIYLFGKIVYNILKAWVKRNNYIKTLFKKNNVKNFFLDDSARLIRYDHNGHDIELEVDEHDSVVGTNSNIYEYNFFPLKEPNRGSLSPSST